MRERERERERKDKERDTKSRRHTIRIKNQICKETEKNKMKKSWKINSFINIRRYVRLDLQKFLIVFVNIYINK